MHHVPGHLIVKKGNWIPVGHNVADYGGFYVTIFDGIGEEDYYKMDDAIEVLKQTVVDSLEDMFPSFRRVRHWDYKGVVVLEDNLAQVVIGENGNSMAVYIVIPSTQHFPQPELGKKQLKRYLAGLQSILLKYYPGQVRFRTGPWSSGILQVAM